MEEEQKYENKIQKYTDTQLIYEIAIVEKQYNTAYMQKKALKEECNRRLNDGRKG